MPHAILDFAYQLLHNQEPFVLATVIWCERPTSAKPGAQAIIQSNGQVTGWIGGSCAQPIVVREALRLLQEGGNPFLLHLGSPDTTSMQRHDDVRIFPMTCTSGGVLEIYMEPHLPSPQLLLVGDSPVIAALRQIASVLDFTITHLDHDDLSQLQINKRTYILIATHGQYDEDVLAEALPSEAAYIGMVSSPRRAEACRASLRALGMAEQHIARLKAPAGINISAVTPEEIAVSILAELVQVQREKALSTMQKQPDVLEQTAPMAETAIDPVCDMIVEIATARHRSSYDGRDFFFCCPACKRQFERNPQEYLVKQKS
ncbi:MAG TPA: XdhC family protein [Ktedonobacteraceae bacterium]|nr:XdhC family protein [Ktedonobacteraceae bacterium]